MAPGVVTHLVTPLGNPPDDRGVCIHPPAHGEHGHQRSVLGEDGEHSIGDSGVAGTVECQRNLVPTGVSMLDVRAWGRRRWRR